MIAGFSNDLTPKIPRSQIIAGFSDDLTPKIARSQMIAGFSDNDTPKIARSLKIAGFLDDLTLHGLGWEHGTVKKSEYLFYVLPLWP
jgi:hypothetical protein